MNAIEVRGVAGEVRKGYRVVARLGSWHLDKERRLIAATAEVDDFLAEEGGPYRVMLRVGPKQWIWPSVEIASLHASIDARLHGVPDVREQ